MIDAATLQPLRHTVLGNQPCQSPDKSRLAHARLADMQRIVLILPAQHLDGALQLALPADEGVVLAVVVVHTGDKTLPAFTGVMLRKVVGIVTPQCVVVRIQPAQVVVKAVVTDKPTQKLALVATQGILQQIARPRLFQRQDAHHQMRDV